MPSGNPGKATQCWPRWWAGINPGTGTGRWLLGTEHWVPVPGIEYWVLGLGQWVLSTGYQIPGAGQQDHPWAPGTPALSAPMGGGATRGGLGPQRPVVHWAEHSSLASQWGRGGARDVCSGLGATFIPGRRKEWKVTQTTSCDGGFSSPGALSGSPPRPCLGGHVPFPG